MEKLKMLKILENRAYRLIDKGLDKEENLNEFRSISETVCRYNDKFLAYAYAERLSIFCVGDEKKLKALKFNELQNIVLRSKDEEYMYLFADRVVGADIKTITKLMPNGALRKKLEKEIRPVNENEL